MASIDSAPDFTKPEFRELIDALKTGTYIFLGAGISRLAGYPLWKELSDKMVEKYWERRDQFKDQDFKYSHKEWLLKEINCIDVMDYLNAIDPQLFQKTIEEELGKDAQDTAIYKRMAVLFNSANRKNIRNQLPYSIGAIFYRYRRVSSFFYSIKAVGGSFNSEAAKSLWK